MPDASSNWIYVVDAESLAAAGSTQATPTNPDPVVASKIKFSDNSEVEIGTSESLKNYYGNTVSSDFFTSNEGSSWNWQLFYDDANYIFLIPSDYIPNSTLTTGTENLITKSGINGTYNASFCTNVNYNDGVLTSTTEYYKGSAANTLSGSTRNDLVDTYLTWVADHSSSTNNNIRAVSYMMDKTKWSQYAGTKYTNAFAIGGPTIELFIASWNAAPAHSSKQLALGILNDNGYAKPTNATSSGDLGTSNTMWLIADNNKAKVYWMASPSSSDANNVCNVNCGGFVDNGYAYSNVSGFRPVVVIPKTDIVV